ncbi:MULTISPECIES: hypothetical protein [Paraburkholderia]|uniref:Uncharacterized protein n=1 Tax=Paraburkholderia unamae TaxID=219649 RepID=A0ACC6REZ0_9BURK
MLAEKPLIEEDTLEPFLLSETAGAVSRAAPSSTLLDQFEAA